LGKLFWEEKGRKWVLFMEPKATLLTLVSLSADVWSLQCLGGIWEFTGTLAEAKVWAFSVLEKEVFPWILTNSPN